jgi:hypothetical protein
MIHCGDVTCLRICQVSSAADAVARSRPIPSNSALRLPKKAVTPSMKSWTRPARVADSVRAKAAITSLLTTRCQHSWPGSPHNLTGITERLTFLLKVACRPIVLKNSLRKFELVRSEKIRPRQSLSVRLNVQICTESNCRDPRDQKFGRPFVKTEFFNRIDP